MKGQTESWEEEFQCRHGIFRRAKISHRQNEGNFLQLTLSNKERQWPQRKGAGIMETCLHSQGCSYRWSCCIEPAFVHETAYELAVIRAV